MFNFLGVSARMISRARDYNRSLRPRGQGPGLIESYEQPQAGCMLAHALSQLTGICMIQRVNKRAPISSQQDP